MAKNKNVEIWLSISQSLFRDLKPESVGSEIIGCGMPPDEFAALVDRETNRINDALIAISLAKDKFEVRKIFNALSENTIIALCSRWAHYHGAWTKMVDDPHPPLWFPPSDMWRAIFLAMTDDVSAASKAARLIWGEGFEE